MPQEGERALLSCSFHCQPSSLRRCSIRHLGAGVQKADVPDRRREETKRKPERDVTAENSEEVSEVGRLPAVPRALHQNPGRHLHKRPADNREQEFVRPADRGQRSVFVRVPAGQRDSDNPFLRRQRARRRTHAPGLLLHVHLAEPRREGAEQKGLLAARLAATRHRVAAEGHAGPTE